MSNSELQDVVRIAGVSRRFGDLVALDDVSLSLRQGDIVGLIGRSGAGKSTLIRCLNGLDRPERGSIEIGGVDITTLDEARLLPVRRRIGMVFQHFNLLSAKTVLDNVALPLKIAGVSREKRTARVRELLELVGLSGKEAAYPAQLSGGQKQRVGIARALAADPLLLLSDEATSALDAETTQQILELLNDLNRKLGLTILLITHEIEVVRQIARTVVVLDAGRIVEQGDVRHVLSSPQRPTTRSLLRSLLPQLPNETLKRLQPVKGRFSILEVSVTGTAARQPLFDLLASASGGPVVLLSANVQDIQGEPAGHLYLQIPALRRDSLVKLKDTLAPKGIVLTDRGYAN
ncbi:methionine ABC transporter ATP-binding protein [Aestuariivirga sp.]|uniref:methionine ABC transporter ATP-binding protein n=1 Tax=Aestuariivirga sp. TaxID=2650926 RepID=UPI0039E4D777